MIAKAHETKIARVQFLSGKAFQILGQHNESRRAGDDTTADTLWAKKMRAESEMSDLINELEDDGFQLTWNTEIGRYDVGEPRREYRGF